MLINHVSFELGLMNAEDGKYEHLKELEGAKERLHLVKGDILDYESLIEVIRGCDGVFHMACLLIDDPVSYRP